MKNGDVEVQTGFVIPAAEIVEVASRSSGPGGQHVNKSSTRVTLRWRLTTSRILSPDVRERLLHRLGARLTRRGELVVHADRARSRERNREAARNRIVQLLRDAMRESPPRHATRPSRGVRERGRLARQRHSTLKRNRMRVRRDEV
jgi:ribosome-associated protein